MEKMEFEIQDEGSWALMIEQSNVKALQKYHGSMAKLNIKYYLSIGKDRYYKSYFEKDNIRHNRKCLQAFLLDDRMYYNCLVNIERILNAMKAVENVYRNMDLIGKFDYYCDLLCEYIAYYNSIIADTFYQDIYNIVDMKIPAHLRFALNEIKDSLFAVNNDELLSHMQTVDIVNLAEKYVSGNMVDADLEEYVKKYKATTTSSGNPNGISIDEVKKYCEMQTTEGLRHEKAFLANLHFRYINSAEWSKLTAESLKLDEETKTLIRRTSHLSYLKIKMREEFQNFKIVTRNNFLNMLILEIGKSNFDYMLIDEIRDYIISNEMVSKETIDMRKEQIVFEMRGDEIKILNTIPQHIKIEDVLHGEELTGDVLIGAGTKRYIVKKIEQDEFGLNDFNDFINTVSKKSEIAIVTNVLRPFLVPKLKNFGVLITQYGGFTSHASVLCRELGINSMISVKGVMDYIKTGEMIEVDFNKKTLKKVEEIDIEKTDDCTVVVDLMTNKSHTSKEIGNKALNIIKINNIAPIPKGFALTSYALRNLKSISVQDEIMKRINDLGCKMVAIRSSHESEDGTNASYAGLFESFVNIEVDNRENIFDKIQAVYNSANEKNLEKYSDLKSGNMHVIVQEMIVADISGVILTSEPHNGYDYMLIEYIVGDLCYLMQGDITPLITYIMKKDILTDTENFHAYPSIVCKSLSSAFLELAKYAIKIEETFSHRVEIEFGIRGNEIYIFQARPY